MNENILKNWAILLASFVLLSLSALASAHEGESSAVYLRGTFNGWDATAMTDTSGGIVWDVNNVRFCGAAPHQFKVDVGGRWSNLFGAPADRYQLTTADWTRLYIDNSKNIELVTSGIYSIRAVVNDYPYVEVHKTANCEPTVYLRGTFNKWGLLAMTPVSIGSSEYAAYINVGGGTQTFKFDYTTTWSQAYGDKNLDFIGDLNGADIVIKNGAGNYKITWNHITRRYSISKQASGCGSAYSTMFLMSSALNFGVNPNTGTGTGSGNAMTCTNGLWQTTEIFAGSGSVFQAGAYKFAANLAYNPNWGFGPKPGVAQLTGGDIVIPEGKQGTYLVQFNEKTLAYNIVRQVSACAPRMTVRGSFNGWGTQDLYCIGANEWAAIVMFSNANTQFKFDAKGDWTESYGDNAPADGVADLKSSTNITKAASGRYLIRFNTSTRKYSLRLVSRACLNPSMYMLREDTNWEDHPAPMECENGHWAAEAHFHNPTSAVFSVTGTWAGIYGETTAPQRKVDNSGNVSYEGDSIQEWTRYIGPLPEGQYHIHVYDRTDEKGATGPNYKFCQNFTCTQ